MDLKERIINYLHELEHVNSLGIASKQQKDLYELMQDLCVEVIVNDGLTIITWKCEAWFINWMACPIVNETIIFSRTGVCDYKRIFHEFSNSDMEFLKKDHRDAFEIIESTKQKAQKLFGKTK